MLTDFGATNILWFVEFASKIVEYQPTTTWHGHLFDRWIRFVEGNKALFILGPYPQPYTTIKE